MFPNDGVCVFVCVCVCVKNFQLRGHLKAARIDPEERKMQTVLLFLQFADTGWTGVTAKFGFMRTVRLNYLHVSCCR